MGTREIRATPAVLHVLLTLAEGDRHGYAILSEVEARSGGRVSLGPSSLYYTLGRLADAGLIEDGVEPPETTDATPHEGQRRYFSLTSAGRERLRTEMGVLTDLIRHAEALGFPADG